MTTGGSGRRTCRRWNRQVGPSPANVRSHLAEAAAAVEAAQRAEGHGQAIQGGVGMDGRLEAWAELPPQTVTLAAVASAAQTTCVAYTMPGLGLKCSKGSGGLVWQMDGGRPGPSPRPIGGNGKGSGRSKGGGPLGRTLSLNSAVDMRSRPLREAATAVAAAVAAAAA